jgi:hypothetical protein
MGLSGCSKCLLLLVGGDGKAHLDSIFESKEIPKVDIIEVLQGVGDRCGSKGFFKVDRVILILVLKV